MDKRWQLAGHYLTYIIKSRHLKGHGIHSPFVYEFVSQVLFDREIYPEYADIRNIRNELKNSGNVLTVTDLGEESHRFTGESRSIRNLITQSSVPPKYGKLLFRIGRYYNPSTIIELGTSIGLSTLYLAKGAPNARIVSIEGNAGICEFARSLFKKYQAGNIKAINGMFDDYLPYLDEKYPLPGLVFIDGNHTFEATLRYFHYFVSRMEEGFLIFDDINWSDGMRKAWKTIVLDTRARVTIDLFFIGIVIIRKSVTPGHYKIRF